MATDDPETTKITAGLTEAIEIASGRRTAAGIVITFTREEFLGGLRFDPGRYRITRIDQKEKDDVQF